MPVEACETDERNPMALDTRTRWLALYVLCLGSLMIVLDSTVVTVALPSIRADFGFVASGGGTLGVLLGGVLTDTLDWHWIFLINLPIGVLVAVLALKLLPAGRAHQLTQRLDVLGAITVTAALVIAVYAIVNGND